MKKLLLTSFAALMFTATADAGFYVGGYVSGFDIKDNFAIFDNIALDATVGYRFTNGLRVEADVLGIMMEPGFGDFRFGLMQARALYDIKINDQLVPYFGIGVDTGIYSGRAEQFAFTGALVAGVAYYLDRNLALDLMYTRGLGIALGYTNDINTFNNEVRLGMRYHF